MLKQDRQNADRVQPSVITAPGNHSRVEPSETQAEAGREGDD
jgi:hypothetical protein